MKYIIALLLLISPCKSQTVAVTGALQNATGKTCTFIFNSTTNSGQIIYGIVDGDFSSAQSGYISGMSTLRKHAPLILNLDTYSIISFCSGLNAPKYYHNVKLINTPTIDINVLLNGNKGLSISQWLFSISNMQGSISVQ